jgi:hypothetical protein
METYRILCNGRVIYNEISQDEMFDIIDELSEQFYETGVPNPGDLMVECIRTQEI